MAARLRVDMAKGCGRIVSNWADSGCVFYNTSHASFTTEYLMSEVRPERTRCLPRHARLSLGPDFVKAGTMASSTFQEETLSRVRLLLRGYRIVENFRPDWLANPETGRNLEIDIYLPDFKIGVEVQGRQHYEFVPLFHESEDDLVSQIERDKIKKELCLEHGVHLYEIFTLGDVDSFIYSLRYYHKDVWRDLANKNHEIKGLSYWSARLYEASRQRPKPTARMKNLSDKIISVAKKYDIPLNSIKPDFTIKKEEMHYTGYPIVHIFKIDDNGEIIRDRDAALRSVENGTAKVFFDDRRGYELIADIDLETYKGVDQDGNTWMIDQNSEHLNDERFYGRKIKADNRWFEAGDTVRIYRPERGINQIGEIIEVSTEDAKVKTIGKGGKEFLIWVKGKHLYHIDEDVPEYS